MRMLDPLLAYSRRVLPPNERLVWASDQLSKAEDGAALEVLAQAAESGNPFALCRLSVHYSDVARPSFSPDQAMSYAKRAAEINFAPGLFLVGSYYETGIGVSRDVEIARKHFELSAEGGYGVAAIHLALALADGRLGVTSIERAVELLSLAANNGDSTCAMQLALWYEGGTGSAITKDNERALKWYEYAAELGSTLANFRLATAYFRGDLGVRRDPSRARKYMEDCERGDLA
jgi:TPR repeat protein